jgi:hypothetical protein
MLTYADEGRRVDRAEEGGATPGHSDVVMCSDVVLPVSLLPMPSTQPRMLAYAEVIGASYAGVC